LYFSQKKPALGFFLAEQNILKSSVSKKITDFLPKFVLQPEKTGIRFFAG
jgi:hypothetical protein